MNLWFANMLKDKIRLVYAKAKVSIIEVFPSGSMGIGGLKPVWQYVFEFVAEGVGKVLNYLKDLQRQEKRELSVPMFIRVVSYDSWKQNYSK